MEHVAKTGVGMQVEMDLPYEQALQRATEALKTEGFGVLTEIDVQETLKKKLGADFRRYKILGACNPPLAYQALQIDLDIGLLLPCNVIVYESGEGKSVVSLLDPLAMLGMLESPALKPVTDEARARLGRVAAALRT